MEIEKNYIVKLQVHKNNGAPSEYFFIKVSMVFIVTYFTTYKARANIKRSCPRFLKSTFYLNPLVATQILFS